MLLISNNEYMQVVVIKWIGIVAIVSLVVFGIVMICRKIKESIQEKQYAQLSSEVLKSLNLPCWCYHSADAVVQLKSSRAVTDYDPIRLFKEDRNKLGEAENVLRNKAEYRDLLTSFLKENSFKDRPMYSELETYIKRELPSLSTYNVEVMYRSPAGRSVNYRKIVYSREYIERLKDNPQELMSKSEYNKYVKDQNQELLDQKHHSYYDKVNQIIDLANEKREGLVILDDKKEVDRLISSLFDRTVNAIKKIKSLNSDEWDVIGKIIDHTHQDVSRIIERNLRILGYYNSPDFDKIKMTCASLMGTQREFNEYISEKAQSISALFGSRVVRNETVIDDEYNYIRPYKKTITPFTAEVSAAVFASAENNPLDYIVKYFYPNKSVYPEQIQKLQLLVEELETLKEAKQIIENYKKDYQQYLADVPTFILEDDEDGFYSRLGFANISESVLTVEYSFSYTSGGGMAQRSFSVPMTEETIVDLVSLLQSKLTMTAFAKEQRMMMTSKLRQRIKERDDFTCVCCKNSIHKEPNLLLEVDHIIPVSKGGCTKEDNLQTLCWKCNRQKGNKII